MRADSQTLDKVAIYPGSHYAVEERRLKSAVSQIRNELQKRLKELYSENKLLEAQRIEQRTYLMLNS